MVAESKLRLDKAVEPFMLSVNLFTGIIEKGSWSTTKIRFEHFESAE